MSAPDQFENLMNQFGSEAAAERERAERAVRRKKLFKAILKSFFILVLLAGAAGAYVYRGPLNASLSRLKLRSTGEMQADRKARAEAKAVEVQKVGQKRADEFEATLK